MAYRAPEGPALQRWRLESVNACATIDDTASQLEKVLLTGGEVACQGTQTSCRQAEGGRRHTRPKPCKVSKVTFATAGAELISSQRATIKRLTAELSKAREQEGVKRYKSLQQDLKVRPSFTPQPAQSCATGTCGLHLTFCQQAAWCSHWAARTCAGPALWLSVVTRVSAPHCPCVCVTSLQERDVMVSELRKLLKANTGQRWTDDALNSHIDDKLLLFNVSMCAHTHTHTHTHASGRQSDTHTHTHTVQCPASRYAPNTCSLMSS